VETVSIEAWLADTQEWVERELERSLRTERSDVPPVLAEAMEYAALGGGKRFRAALARLVGRWCGAVDAACAAPAVAVELVHAYSLVHDDLPCMDDDDWRRGRPSCHVRFGEANALLAGDALLTKAFEVLARTQAPWASAAVLALARAAGDAGMVGGQVLDLGLSGGSVTLQQVERMHAQKTGALIAVSAELGALCAGATPQRCAEAREWGRELGRTFQAVDDVLDVTADKHELGKTPGKDAAQNKPTLVAALGLEETRRYAREHAARAEAQARAWGGPWSPTGLQMVDFLLRRRS
jgi:geranylgeranyl pyrophosphate synthase